MRNPNKRVLCIGSSFSSVPIFFILKKYGFKVAVCGINKLDPCHQYADESFFIDYSNKDALLKLVKREKFDFIIPVCNDYSYISAAYVASELGYPGFDNKETVALLHTKDKFRAFTENFNIPAPRSFKYKYNSTSLEDMNLDYPLIVKPVDVFSGRGISKVLCKDELMQSIKFAINASISENIIIEEFKEGSLHSHSAFVQNGKIFTDFFVDEFCTVHPYQVNCSNYPSTISESVRILVRRNMERIIELLNLTNGLIHTQFLFNTRRNEIWIVECMRRAPGDLYGKLIERATNYDYFNAYVRPFVDMKLEFPYTKGQEKCYGRHTISLAKPMIYFSYINYLPGKNMETVMLKNSGKEVDAAPYDKLGIIFTEYENFSSMSSITKQMEKYISVIGME